MIKKWNLAAIFNGIKMAAAYVSFKIAHRGSAQQIPPLALQRCRAPRLLVLFPPRFHHSLPRRLSFRTVPLSARADADYVIPASSPSDDLDGGGPCGWVCQHRRGAL